MQTDNWLVSAAASDWVTESVDLCVICKGMWIEVMTFHQLQQVGGVQEEQDRAKDRALWHSIHNRRWC